MIRIRMSIVFAMVVSMVGLAGAGPSLPVKVPEVKVPGVPGGAPGLGCDDLKAHGVLGARVHGFILASMAIQKQAAEMEAAVGAACKRMAAELGSPQDGNTQAVCSRVAKDLKAALKASVKVKGKAYAKVTPAKCTVDASMEARAQGECNGSGSASGTTGSGGTAASGAGAAECKAAAKARASVDAQCTPPKVETGWEGAAVVDAGGAAKAKKAIEVGLPALIEAAIRAQLAQKAVVAWASSAKSLARGGASFATAFGAKAACVTGKLAASVKGAAAASANVSVSIKASASVSASATGSSKVASK